MFFILYENKKGERVWELVGGEDAMQQRVCELMGILECEEEDIIVFDGDDELN